MQFELLDFVFDPFMLTGSMMRFLSLLLLDPCLCVVSVVMWSSLVCLLFVLHVCMLGECNGTMVREIQVCGMEEVWLW